MARVGLAFILLGASFYIGSRLWEATRIWVPVNIPISLSPGHIKTNEFKLNLDSPYVVYIATDQGSDYQQTLCLIGVQQCEDTPSILRASWTLSDAVKPIATGATGTNQTGSGEWNAFYREIGTFTAHKGKRYNLDLNVLKDASRLNSLNPRLIVQENGQHWLYGPLGNLLWEIAAIFILVGLLLLAYWIFTQAQARRGPMLLSFTSSGQAERLSPQRTPLHISAKPFATSTKLRAWLGAFMMLLGIVSFAGAWHWFATRTFVAVDIPVSLASRHIKTGPFAINLRDLYAVTIDTEDDSWIPYSCYSSLKTSWNLYNNGRVVESQNGGYTYLGQFTSEKATYNLELNILSDPTCLDFSHPHLRIYTDKSAYVDNVNLVLAISLLTSIVGLVLTTLWILPVRRIAHERKLKLTEVSAFGQYFPYAQTLPLKRKFEGFHSFGLVAAITWIIVLFPVWIITQWHEVSMGLSISLLKKGAALIQQDSWTEPIILRIVDAGAGKPPKINLNSKPVLWDDLPHELKEEIWERRPGCTVYIDGDENLPWADVVYAVDIARGLQAKVVLLTKQTPHRIS